MIKRRKIQVELLSSRECSRIYDNGLNPKPLSPDVLIGGPSGTGGPRLFAFVPARWSISSLDALEKKKLGEDKRKIDRIKLLFAHS